MQIHQSRPREPSKTGLRWGTDSPLPDTLAIGQGNVIHIAGWCYHPELRIRRMEFAAGGVRQPVRAFGADRPDMLSAQSAKLDPKRHSMTSGFWGFFPFPADFPKGPVDFFLEVEFANGMQETAKIGSILLPDQPHPAPRTKRTQSVSH
ncbi:MAG: hypothetical protein ABI995_17305 [Acidobacteriota bacterium]